MLFAEWFRHAADAFPTEPKQLGDSSRHLADAQYDSGTPGLGGMMPASHVGKTYHYIYIYISVNDGSDNVNYSYPFAHGPSNFGGGIHLEGLGSMIQKGQGANRIPRLQKGIEQPCLLEKHSRLCWWLVSFWHHFLRKHLVSQMQCLSLKGLKRRSCLNADLVLIRHQASLGFRFSPAILRDVFHVPEHSHAPVIGDDLQHNLCWQLAILALLGLPGYYVSVCFMDRAGRKNIQIQGFAMMALFLGRSCFLIRHGDDNYRYIPDTQNQCLWNIKPGLGIWKSSDGFDSFFWQFPIGTSGCAKILLGVALEATFCRFFRQPGWYQVQSIILRALCDLSRVPGEDGGFASNIALCLWINATWFAKLSLYISENMHKVMCFFSADIVQPMRQCSVAEKNNDIKNQSRNSRQTQVFLQQFWAQ